MRAASRQKKVDEQATKAALKQQMKAAIEAKHAAIEPQDALEDDSDI
jgi:hypothetical protein